MEKDTFVYRSIYKHEQKALSYIYDHMFDNGQFFSCVELKNEQNSSYLECDVIFLSSKLIAVIELKDWRGDIEITNEGGWYKNNILTSDPHIANNFKAKLLKDKIQNKLKYLKSKDIPIIQSIVVLTNTDSTVANADNPKSSLECFKKRTVTFSSLEQFKKYIQSVISNSDVNVILNQTPLNELKNYFLKLAESSALDRKILGRTIREVSYSNKHVTEYILDPNEVEKSPIRARFFGPLATIKNEQFKQRWNSIIVDEELGRHPNILAVKGEMDGDNYIETNYLYNGETLRQYLLQLDEQREPDCDNTIKLASEIAKALSYIHGKSIIHRDLRPENIFITDQVAQLMNFDLSYSLREKDFTVMDDDIQPVTCYTAPELFSDSVDNKSDVYSLGVVLYEMISSSMPFNTFNDLPKERSDRENRLFNHLNEKYSHLDSYQLIKDIILSCTEMDFSLRPEANEIISKILPDTEPKEITVQNVELHTSYVNDSFYIEEIIGEGKTSNVYKAINESQEVVVKLYKHEVPYQIYRREVDALKEIQHPSIVDFKISTRWDDGRNAIILSYIGHSSLKIEIEEHRIPTKEIFINTTVRLLDALNYIHSLGYIHNDINTSNILFNRENNPVIIDLGLLEKFGSGPIVGIKRYIPFDLIDGIYIQYTPRKDIYALSIVLLEWLQGEHFVNTIEINIEDYFNKANVSTIFNNNELKKLTVWFNNCLNDTILESNKVLESFETIFNKSSEPDTVDTFKEDRENELVSEPANSTSINLPQDNAHCVAFELVDYLNSIHSLGGSNENALAESQALSLFFPRIYVEHDIVKIIYDKLINENCAVILTGHAGDGKSTVALDIYKRLKQIDLMEPLKSPLKEKEELLFDGKTFHIIKDMSEISLNDRAEKINEATLSDDRWLIVSNTGPLIDSFIKNCSIEEKLSCENKILKILDNDDPKDILNAKYEHIHGGHTKTFYIVNIAKLSNKKFISQYINKLVSLEEWDLCVQKCSNVEFCPIYKNISLIKSSPKVIDKIKLIYKRLIGYGQKFTSRQIAAHISYALTGNLSCHNMYKFKHDGFFCQVENNLVNTFFGYKGTDIDNDAQNLFSISKINELEFGGDPFISLDKCDSTELKLMISEPDAKEMYDRFLEHPDFKKTQSLYRQQKRRFMYLYSDVEKYNSFFLQSPSIMEQYSVPSEKRKLRDIALYALSLYFTGGSPVNNSLYITLSRTDGIEQNAQLVVAEFYEDDFSIKLHKDFLYFCHKNKDIKGLELSLPLLDYIISTRKGHISTKIDSMNGHKLSRFKADLIESYKHEKPKNSDCLKIINKNNNGTLEICTMAFNNKILEVN